MLECKDLHYAYRPGSEVLRGVDWSFAPGQITAILGPNGAGKTTLLKLLLGALDPLRGTVTLKGKPVHTLEPRELARNISYIPQRGGSDFAFTVEQILELGVLPGGDSAIVGRVAGEHSLTDLRSRPASELSEGQRQRVTLARAIVQTESSRAPMCEKILLADEPFSAMDPRQERLAMATLRNMAQKGCCVAIVLHDLRTTAKLATHAILLDEIGQMKASGPVETVLAPKNLEAVFGLVE